MVTWSLCGNFLVLSFNISYFYIVLLSFLDRFKFSMNEMKMKLFVKSGKLKRLMGLRVHQDGFKAVNSLEWQSEVASVRIVFDVHFMLEFWVNNRLIMICVSL